MTRLFLLIVLILLLAAGAWGLLKWKSRLPHPTGDFAVGTTHVDWAADKLTPPRSIAVQIWYPAQPDALKKILHRLTGNPEETDVPVAEGRFPVLVYAHGWGCTIRDNASLAQDLASHGFIVTALAYPTGQNLPDPKIPLPFVPESAFIAGLAKGDQIVHVQADDSSYALDVLTQWNQADPNQRFTGHLDLDHAGVIGFSVGGATAAQSGWQDPRFKAVINLDGWLFADASTQFIHQPYLKLKDGLELPKPEDATGPDGFLKNFTRLRIRDLNQENAQLAQGNGYRVMIMGSDHANFSDLPLTGKPHTVGPIDPKYCLKIMHAYVIEFFGKYLLGKPAPLLDGTPPYKEAKVEVFPVTH